MHFLQNELLTLVSFCPKTRELLFKSPNSVMRGNTLTLPFLFVSFFFFWKKVRESLLPSIVSSGFDLSMQGNKLSITFFQKRSKGRGKRRVSTLPSMISEVLEGLVLTSKWPRNGAKFLASPRPRPRKNIFLLLDLGLDPR